MIDGQFYRANITKNWLDRHGFEPETYFSRPEDNSYTLRFPVWRSEGITALECEIIVWNDGHVTHNVYADRFTRSRYASYYCCKQGEDNKVDIIHERILEKYKELGIRRM